MNVIKSGGVYRASQISGPRHNYLALALAHEQPEKVRIMRHAMEDEHACQINEEQLLAAVLGAVNERHRDGAQPLFVECVEYVPSDTPDYTVYAHLTKVIIQAASADFR